MTKGKLEDTAATARVEMPERIELDEPSWLDHGGKRGKECAAIDWLLLRGDLTVHGIAAEASTLVGKYVTSGRVSSHITHLGKPVPDGHGLIVHRLDGDVRSLRPSSFSSGNDRGLRTHQNSAGEIKPAAPSEDGIDPETEFETVRRRKRRPDVVRAAKIARKFKCQLCPEVFAVPDRNPYCEVHHIKPLGEPHGGEDRLGNVIVVCPNDHVRLQFGLIRLDRNDLPPADVHVIDPEMIHWHNENICVRSSVQS